MSQKKPFAHKAFRQFRGETNADALKRIRKLLTAAKTELSRARRAPVLGDNSGVKVAALTARIDDLQKAQTGLTKKGAAQPAHTNPGKVIRDTRLTERAAQDMVTPLAEPKEPKASPRSDRQQKPAA